MTRVQEALIVEDDRIVAMHLRLLVEDLGFHVSGVVSSGSEALQVAETTPPDLVLMDIRLKGEYDGIETARRLGERHQPAMVFISAYSDDASIDRAMQAGAHGYLVKPFSKPQLRAAVSGAMRERGRMDASSRTPSVASRARPAAIPFGAGARVALYSHDTLGLGHLQRCSNIARTLVAEVPGVSVLLLTGSPAVHRYTLPVGIDYVKLPSVKKNASEDYSARSLGVSDDEVVRFRSNLILQSLQDYAPDVLIVDHAPLGMKGEILPALEWLGKHRPHCARMLGLRDIIDTPEAVQADWHERGIYAALERHYHHLLIYGQEEIFDTSTAYGFPESLKAKTRYCGFVAEPESSLDPMLVQGALKPGMQTVTVTTGGGEGAGELVIGNYLDMLERHAESVAWHSVVLPGPFIPDELRVSLLTQVARLSSKVSLAFVDFVESTTPFMAASDFVICTGGYNTTTQLLRVGHRALMIPRVMHRQEQTLRAERLRALGLIETLEPTAVTPDALFEAVRAGLASTTRPLAEARDRGQIRFDGAHAIVDVCRTLTLR